MPLIGARRALLRKTPIVLSAAPTVFLPESQPAEGTNLGYPSSYTFPAVDLGVTPESGDIVALLFYNSNSNASQNVTSLDVGGVEADYCGTGNNEFYAQIWAATGVVANRQDITFTTNYGLNNLCLMVCVLRGILSATPLSIGSGPGGYPADPQEFVAPLTMPNNSVGLVFLASTGSDPSSYSDATLFGGGSAGLIGGYNVNTSGESVSWNPQFNGYSYSGVEMLGCVFH